MDGTWTLLVGIALAAIGAVGATVTQRRLEEGGRAARAPLRLVPFGVLIGAGAAIARGWDIVPAIVLGSLFVPLVGALGRLLEVRRSRRRPGSSPSARRGEVS